jgi:hypothetical protein
MYLRYKKPEEEPQSTNKQTKWKTPSVFIKIKITCNTFIICDTILLQTVKIYGLQTVYQLGQMRTASWRENRVVIPLCVVNKYPCEDDIYEGLQKASDSNDTDWLSNISV